MFSIIPRQLQIHSNLKLYSRRDAIWRMVGRFPAFLSSLDLEWKMTYVGDYRSTEGDQVLDDVLVGPITQGTHKFCFQVRGLRFPFIRRRTLPIWRLFRMIV